MDSFSCRRRILHLLDPTSNREGFTRYDAFAGATILVVFFHTVWRLQWRINPVAYGVMNRVMRKEFLKVLRRQKENWRRQLFAPKNGFYLYSSVFFVIWEGSKIMQNKIQWYFHSDSFSWSRNCWAFSQQYWDGDFEWIIQLRNTLWISGLRWLVDVLRRKSFSISPTMAACRKE